MDSKNPFTVLAPSIFKGERYHVWVARMESHMEANYLLEAVEEDYEVSSLACKSNHDTYKESRGEENNK